MPKSSKSAQITRVAAMLRGCRRILFITGAGVSADSGLPTYRGFGGLYQDRITDEGLPIESVIAGQMLRSRPELTWKYLMQIEEATRGAVPNEAHRTIAAMEEHFPHVWVLTQNVDGLHQLAGSKKVIDIHGDVHAINCMACSYTTRVADYSHFELPPKCPECSGILRPGVILFGEQLPAEQCRVLFRESAKGFDIVFTVGTTSVFPYIARPIHEARARQVPTVEINPGTTEVSDYVTEKIPLGAADALSAIWQEFQASQPA